MTLPSVSEVKEALTNYELMCQEHKVHKSSNILHSIAQAYCDGRLVEVDYPRNAMEPFCPVCYNGKSFCRCIRPKETSNSSNT